MDVVERSPTAGSARFAEEPRSLLALLAACTATGPIATNLFLPALPDIRSHFGVSVAASQTMLTTYLIAFALGLLVSGPVSDRYGRRPLMIGGMAVFAAGSLLCALSPTLGWLVIGRIVQAVGTAAVFTVSRAVVGDVFHGPRLAQHIASLTMVIVIGTTISPWLGGIVAVYGGWQGGFWILLAVGVVLVGVCWRLLPETRTAHAPRDFATLGRSMRALLAKPVFLGYALQVGVIYSIFMVFISLAPYILADALARPPSEFGVYYILISVGYFFGNLQVSKRAHSTSSERLATLGLVIQLGFAALTLGFVLAGLAHPLWLFGPMLPLAFGQGLTLPTVTARAVSLAPGFAGAASSLMGFAQQATAAVSVQAMGWTSTDSAVPVMVFCTAAATLAMLPIVARAVRRRS